MFTRNGRKEEFGAVPVGRGPACRRATRTRPRRWRSCLARPSFRRSQVSRPKAPPHAISMTTARGTEHEDTQKACASEGRGKNERETSPPEGKGKEVRRAVPGPFCHKTRLPPAANGSAIRIPPSRMNELNVRFQMWIEMKKCKARIRLER